jgi:hypothetical protein
MEANKDTHKPEQENLLQFIQPKKVEELDINFLIQMHENIIEQHSPKKTKKIHFMRYASLLVAASVAILVIINLNKNPKQAPEVTASQQEIMAYLVDEFDYSNSEILEDFSVQHLESTSFFEYQSLDNKKTKQEISTLPFELEQEEVLEYLDEEEFDFESDLLIP